MNDRLARNIPLYYVMRALTLPFFWLPILYYYLTAIKGFSVAETTILLGLQEFLLIFLEVPTGVVADKVSRKFSIALGTLIIPLPFVFLPYITTYASALIIFFFRAVGKALVSGADSALLYDTLIDLDRTSEFKKIKTKSVAWMMGVSAAAIFFGGWMGQYGLYQLALSLPLPLYLISFAAILLMVEPESSKKSKEIQEVNYLKHVGKAIKIVVSHRGVLVIAIAFAFLEGLAVNMKWYYPAIFEHLGFGLGLIGTIMSALYLVKSFAYSIGSRLILNSSFKNTLFWVGVIAASWVMSSAYTNSLVTLPALVLILLGSELAVNSAEELIHDGLESGVRATAMSFVNLLSSVAATVMIGLWGVIIDIRSLQSSMFMQGAIFVVIAIMLYNLRNELVKQN
ncbi:MAG: MFS transporter [Candidatus Moraniibacteriota bacterium]|nr:MAG: MFS transporter [Candidatus Moranbacteria bacterium]